MNEVIKSKEYLTNLNKSNKKILSHLNKNISDKLNFRPYQKKAINILNWITNKKNNTVIKKSLIDKTYGNFPIYTFEMATGSGKTLLIASSILYNHKTFNQKDFLILTPPNGKSAIYEKTIKNFTKGSKEYLFSNETQINFNLITGESFTRRDFSYNENADFNIYVFNISKFFENSNGVKSIDKIHETSIWKDSHASLISFRKYLKNINNLNIIIDESHHFQKYNQLGDISSSKGNSAGDIIRDLNPSSVIEFTATSTAKQSPIFRYPINEFINDRYGKKVRAWGIKCASNDSVKNEIAINDKIRFIHALAVHMVKKTALNYNANKEKKPILLIKAKNTEHADNLYNVINNGFQTSLIQEIYNEIISNDSYEINSLIKKHITIEALLSEFNNLQSKILVYHTKNDSKQTNTLFSDLETNDIEILIQVDKATEGWNIDNVYTILILSNNYGEIKNNVKQLIGRGLRLFTNKRIHDENPNSLKRETEILHIVCEQGNNFAKFINTLRDEIGFNEANFSSEKRIDKRINRVNRYFIDKYNNITLPIITRESFSDLNNISKLMDKLTYKELEMDSFVRQITNPWLDKNNTRILKWAYNASSQELDMISNTKVMEKNQYTQKTLKLNSKDVDTIVDSVISSQTILPATKEIEDILTNSIKTIFTKYNIEYNSNLIEKDIKDKFIKFLVKFIKTKISSYFQPQTAISGRKEFTSIFSEHTINIEFSNNLPTNISSIKEFDNIISNKKSISKLFIKDFKKSYFAFAKFDSSQELILAKNLDSMDEVEFWIKNKSSGAFSISYGIGKHFNPDFIVKLKNDSKIYILEVKADNLVDYSKDKIEIMRESNELTEEFLNIFILASDIDKIKKKTIQNFQTIIDISVI